MVEALRPPAWQNGWTIKDIADGRILLTKDGETLALVYRK
jgi:hypothetical protein